MTNVNQAEFEGKIAIVTGAASERKQQQQLKPQQNEESRSD